MAGRMDDLLAPDIVAGRKDFGHCECDLIRSNGTAIRKERRRRPAATSSSFARASDIRPAGITAARYRSPGDQPQLRRLRE